MPWNKVICLTIDVEIDAFIPVLWIQLRVLKEFSTGWATCFSYMD